MFKRPATSKSGWKQATTGSVWRRTLTLQVLEHRKQPQEGSRQAYIGLLVKLCSSTRDVKRGKEIHAEALRSGSGSCIYVANALVSMYAKCGCILDAHRVFERIQRPTVVSWTALILGYAQNGESEKALDMFARMKSQGCEPNSFTFVAVLKACSSLASQNRREECLVRGKQIHSEIGSHLNALVQNTLIDMYSKCRSMVNARRVFDSIEHPAVVAWTALILGYAENGEGDTALDLFARMASQGCEPDSITCVAALKACALHALGENENARSKCLERGRQIHSKITGNLDNYVQGALIEMYAKCGGLLEARQVFDRMKLPDVVSWTSLIMGYADYGDSSTALHLFARMRSQGCAPDCITFVAALKACASLGLEQSASGKAECLEQGKRIHAEIHSMHLDIYVQSTLVDMYAKCGSTEDAQKTFDSMKRPNVVSWNALIFGYANNGEPATALDLYTRMRLQGCAPDYKTFVAVFKACGLIGALETGSRIHHKEIGTGTREHHATLITSLVDFYAKCGSLTEAERIFYYQARTRDLTTWNALLTGYTRLADYEAAFRLFEEMQDAAFQPDGITFLCLLTCCNHAGLVEQAKEFFREMSTVHRIAPTVEHHNCMVDILGRSNKLENGMALLRSMSCKPNAFTWMTVLGACHKWKNVEIGSLAFESLLGLDDTSATAYVLMAQLYGSRGMRVEQEKVLAMRYQRRAWKASGLCCWTNEAGDVHTFLVEGSGAI